ncbi:hypothetical protein F2P81_008932 [Scophthalmus maximus]|uniref:Uncharacterized protein n=1 Tax=Scophthalmus maximus TaxID=52904 RepID=A0A6A4T291_SCOMX|nr:hypothetical protein F2P81_008932 [Scophthalmus maximus]
MASFPNWRSTASTEGEVGSRPDVTQSLFEEELWRLQCSSPETLAAVGGLSSAHRYFADQLERRGSVTVVKKHLMLTDFACLHHMRKY